LRLIENGKYDYVRRGFVVRKIFCIGGEYFAAGLFDMNASTHSNAVILVTVQPPSFPLPH
jgi:hypothetical protein